MPQDQGPDLAVHPSALLRTQVTLQTTALLLPWTGPNIWTSSASEIYEEIKKAIGSPDWIGFLEWDIAIYDSQGLVLRRPPWFLPEATGADYALNDLKDQMSGWVESNDRVFCEVVIRPQPDLNYRCRLSSEAQTQSPS